MWNTQYSAVIVLILYGFSTEFTKTASAELDCDYFDTVDLSGIQPFPNGSYLYEQLLIPANLTDTYDYELTADSDERIPVNKHIRGCACRLKSCVRFCCHYNQMLINNTCVGVTDTALEYDPILNVTMSDGSVVERNVLNDFVVQRHLPMPCLEMGSYFLDDRTEGNEWSLFENGTLMRKFDGVLLTKRDYCLQPTIVAELPSQEIRLVPHNCHLLVSNTATASKVVIPITLLCFFITIGVYLYLPKLRNLHGKCFVCYLVSLFIGYSMLLLDLYKALINHFYLCYITAYLGYFGIMAAFFWLTVISLDLWNSFRGTNYNVNRFTSGNRFLVYNLYAWGMSLLLTVVIAILDQVLLDPFAEDLTWIPGVYITGCWIKTYDWSAMVYFYGPMLILILFNTTLFVLTTARIMVIKKDIQTVYTNRQARRRRSNSEETYSLFSRLFVIMGISWSLEIISYLVQNHKLWKEIFLIADYFHYAQGIVILILFVLKRSVLKLFINRITGKISVEDIDNSEEEVSLQEEK